MSTSVNWKNTIVLSKIEQFVHVISAIAKILLLLRSTSVG